MRKYERRKRIISALKALTGCAGWGILGYLLMTIGWFWPGWILMTVSLCAGAYVVDRLMKPNGRAGA